MMLRDALTKTQRERCYNEAFKALKALLNAPESKDLIENIDLEEPSHRMVKLLLTNEGLLKYSNHSHDRVNPTIELVREYELNEGTLKALLAKLKAE